MLETEVNKNQVVAKTNYQEIILKNEAYFYSLLKDINRAKISVDLSTYIFNADRLGSNIMAELSAAASRGVKVRLLIDGIGSWFFSQDCANKLKASGVLLRIYHPLPWMLSQWSIAAHTPESFLKKFFYLLTMINSRNHRKICLIDNSITYISSANIDACHLPIKEGGRGWRDTTIRISSHDIRILRIAFDLAWDYAPVRKMKKTKNMKRTIDRSIFSLNITRRQRRKLYKKLLLRIFRCKKRIWITNAYFAPDSYILKALIAAAKRGVDVRILLPETTDILISKFVANTFYSDLLKNNVSIFEYLKSILHAKIMILDDLYIVGSSNLNSRSLKHDLEVDVAIQTDTAKKILEKQFIEDLHASQEIHLSDLKKQSFIKNLIGHLFLFLRYWI